MKQAVFDLESNSSDYREASVVWCLCLKDLEKPEIEKYGPQDIRTAIERLSIYDRLIGHNIIGYDLPLLFRLYSFTPTGGCIDTLVLSRLENPDRMVPWGWTGKWEPHSLRAWALRLGMAKKIEHEDWSQFSENMMLRCEHDVRINEAVYKALCKEMRE